MVCSEGHAAQGRGLNLPLLLLSVPRYAVRAGDAGQHEHRVQHRIQELHTGARHAQGESVSHSSGDGSICQFGDRGCSRGWVLGVSLQAYVTDGPMPCRVAGFILGCILFFRCASLLVVTLLLATDLWPPALMHHLLCSLLGLSTMLLEARPLLCTAHARKKTREYLKLFSFLWGRGVLNLIIAALLVLRYPEVTDLSLAGAFAALAAIDVVVGVASQRRLQALRETLTEDEKLLKDKFEAHRDASGKVQAKELAAICTELGSRLSHDELEHAILTVDVSHTIASHRCHHHVIAQSHSCLCESVDVCTDDQERLLGLRNLCRLVRARSHSTPRPFPLAQQLPDVR